MTTIAVTGATGFVGQTLVRLAVERRFDIQALTRHPHVDTAAVRWVDGALDRPESLSALVRGADAVIHVAGVVNAADKAGFTAGNVAGTAAMLIAARAAGIDRFIHVSSLSAREPELSDYGWSKAGAERLVAASGLDWTIVRPPWVYGPGDLDTLDLFRAAKWGIVPVPPAGRVSVIEVSDLARLLLALVDDRDSFGAILEPDDGAMSGWTHEAFAQAIGASVGKKAKPLRLPRSVLNLASRADRLFRRKRARLTADRVAYFCHPDWTIDPATRPNPALWTPQVETTTGLINTAKWYRDKGWL